MPPMTFSSMAPLTVTDFMALPENSDIRLELQEGGFVVKPRPTVRHQAAMLELLMQANPQLPGGVVAVHNIDVDLQLAPADAPGTVRVPDLVVLERPGYLRVRDGDDYTRASDLVLVGEILCPGSHRTDKTIKHAEYAAAGIEHYWIVDLDGGPSLTACHLAGSAYLDAAPVTGVFETDLPFPVRIDLPALLD